MFYYKNSNLRLVFFVDGDWLFEYRGSLSDWSHQVVVGASSRVSCRSLVLLSLPSLARLSTQERLLATRTLLVRMKHASIRLRS